MRRLATLLLLGAVAPVALVWSPSAAQSTFDETADALRSDPVFVDPDAENAITDEQADDLRQQIRDGSTPVFVAILPASAIEAAGGDAGDLPQAVGEATGLAGTYAVVAGDSFRAGSNVLPQGVAPQLATAAFQEASSDGPYAVLDEFVSRIDDYAAEAGTPGSSGNGAGGDEDDGFPWGVVLLGAGATAGGVLVWRSRRRKRAEAAERARELQAERQMLQAELSVLADDVLRLEDAVTVHERARPDYDAAVIRYRAAQAALTQTQQPVDVVRVRRVVDEARYLMDRARARTEGREPAPPPEELTRPGRHGEPALTLDPQLEPTYVGYPGPFATGWFGGGNGLFTGLLLGSMMGGWGWGGPIVVDGSAGEGGGFDGGGFGDFGGGDFGGGLGDFGGGDFGGGDF